MGEISSKISQLIFIGSGYWIFYASRKRHRRKDLP